MLAGEIGQRPAGSAGGRAALEYAKAQFASWGYDVEVQPFTTSSQLLREASVAIEAPEIAEIEALAFVRAASGDVAGPLVDAGTGDSFPEGAQGAVLLIERGIDFIDLARRAEGAGAVAVVLVNDSPELFQGFFLEDVSIPFVGIDARDGERLRDLLADGPVRLRVTVEPERELTARNVIARPEDGRCRTISAGHYDSVPVSPGANDNASGSAIVLELARAAAVAQLSGNCFVLFSAEEIGLDGSRFFVSQLDETEEAELVAMFNYDDVGGDEPPLLIGSRDLGDRVEALAGRLGLEVQRGVLPETASSDHASFLDAGIPALMFSGTIDYEVIHTAHDTVANLNVPGLEEVARLGFAMLQELAEMAP